MLLSTISTMAFKHMCTLPWALISDRDGGSQDLYLGSHARRLRWGLEYPKKVSISERM